MGGLVYFWEWLTEKFEAARNVYVHVACNTFSLCFTLTVCSTGNRWAFCATKLPPLSSQQKRLDQATVTSIHCQGHWFQPIWRRQEIIFKCESTQYRKGKLTRSQWSSTVSILTPATHIWGTQQKDAIKLKQQKKKTQKKANQIKRKPITTTKGKKSFLKISSFLPREFCCLSHAALDRAAALLCFHTCSSLVAEFYRKHHSCFWCLEKSCQCFETFL